MLYPPTESYQTDWANPAARFRGTPFWSWNCELNRERLFRQLEDLRAMGFGGAHIHCRTGLATTYLGEEFMQLVKDCADHSRELGMLTWLYDEDRWPSGFAGGLVTQDPEFRARHLVLTQKPYTLQESGSGTNISTAEAGREGNGRLLWRYAIVLDAAGALAGFQRLADGELIPSGATVWYAYLETSAPGAWFNGQTYVDSLNPRAIQRFVELTHEKYRAVLGDRFGRDVPAIFTDEPQFSRKSTCEDPFSSKDHILPWTEDLTETFVAEFGFAIEDRLPEILWELPNRAPSLARYRYHDHVAERFAAAFGDTISKWCRSYGIALTGHMMEESGLGGQTAALGEAMRSYRAFDIPGIDILMDRIELTTAKQAQSAARQFGCPGLLSELYGVTGWHFDFAGHKRQGDWQAALGVTVRVPHLAWVSMRGEAKRDYPAAIGWQSPWFREYPVVEDHFARLNTVLTRGHPIARIAVVHPIESYWLCFGPLRQTDGERAERECQFQSLAEWLLFGAMDFDYLCESLLPTQCEVGNQAKLTVGSMSYEAVLVPAMRTIRGTTLDHLEAFQAAGGLLVFAGEVPTLVDGILSDRAAQLANRATMVDFSQVAILESVEPMRSVRIQAGEGGSWMERSAPRESLLHQLRAEGDRCYLFVCNTDRSRGRPGTRIGLRGEWQFTALDTVTGDQFKLAAIIAKGWTEIVWDAPAHGSLLIDAHPATESVGISLQEPRREEVGRLPDPVRISLSEPNVLLLDQAEWRVNSGPWQPREEVLRLANLARVQLGLPKGHGHSMQPWADKRPSPTVGFLGMRFTIHSEVEVTESLLACEDLDGAQIFWDGEPVPVVRTGFFTDADIATVPLPPITAGTHQLVVRHSVHRNSALEWCYLLGDFGVAVAGSYARIIAPVRELAWGDWTRQGLPFYAGNLSYHCPRPVESVWLEVPHYAGALVAVDLGDERLASLAFAPFRCALPPPTEGKNLSLTVFGNRANAFGPVHNANAQLRWLGPESWRTQGAHWASEYQLCPMGILTAPILSR